MGVNSLARDTLSNTVKYTNALAGNETADIALSSDFLIQEVVLNGTAASVVFDVSTLAAQGFKHLQFRVIARSDQAATSTSTFMRFNGDTAANYSWHGLYGLSGSVGSNSGVSDTGAFIGWVSGNSNTSNAFGGLIIDVLDFASTSKYKTTRALAGNATGIVGLTSGNWRSTSATTSATIYPASGNLMTGTRISLYGSKG